MACTTCNKCNHEPKCRDSIRTSEIGQVLYVEGIDYNGCVKYENFVEMISRFQFAGGALGGQTIEEVLNTPGIPQFSLQGVYIGNWYPR